MRKFSTILISFLLVGAVFLPLNSAIAQTTVPPLRVGVTGGAVGSWDSIIASAGFAGAAYGPNALEPFMLWPLNWSGEFRSRKETES